MVRLRKGFWKRQSLGNHIYEIAQGRRQGRDSQVLKLDYSQFHNSLITVNWFQVSDRIFGLGIKEVQVFL